MHPVAALTAGALHEELVLLGSSVVDAEVEHLAVAAGDARRDGLTGCDDYKA